MNKIKKTVVNAAVLTAVFALTLYYVFHGEDLSALWSCVMQCRAEWLVLACFLVIFFIWGESHIIWYLLKQFGFSAGHGSCFLLSCTGFFFSAVTPSAGGGQPMQLYFMKKMKIPMSVSSIILMLVTITYKLVLVFVQVGIFLFAPGLAEKYMGSVEWIVWLGLFLNIVGISALVLMVFSPGLVRFLTAKILGFLLKMKCVKKAEHLKMRVETALNTYHDASDYLKKNFNVVLKVQLFTFVQRFALFFVTYCVYHALALEGTGWTDIILLQSTISLSVDMLPMPGGMGISEYLFEHIFSAVFGVQLLAGLVLSRGISYYVQLIISGAGAAAAYLRIASGDRS